MRIPKDFPVKVLRSKRAVLSAKRAATCGTCGRIWDDAVATEWTPAPSARCPFEYFHNELTFRDLRVGTVFEFDHPGLPIGSGIARGPWVKVSARRYSEHPTGKYVHRVGTINANVKRITDDE